MNPDKKIIIDELLELSSRLRTVCERRGFPYSASIVTNGWFLDGAMATSLAAHAVEGVQVTIDGPPTSTTATDYT